MKKWYSHFYAVSVFGQKLRQSAWVAVVFFLVEASKVRFPKAWEWSTNVSQPVGGSSTFGFNGSDELGRWMSVFPIGHQIMWVSAALRRVWTLIKQLKGSMSNDQVTEDRSLSFPVVVQVIQRKWNFHQLPTSWGHLFPSLHCQLRRVMSLAFFVRGHDSFQEQSWWKSLWFYEYSGYTLPERVEELHPLLTLLKADLVLFCLLPKCCMEPIRTIPVWHRILLNI